MKKNKPYFIVLGIVTAWAVFSHAYLGVEDGSSGLSILGWVSAVFFVPSGLLMQLLKGGHSNADIRLMATVSWILYSLLAIGITRAVRMIKMPEEPV